MEKLFASIGYNLRRLADFSGRETQILFWPYAGLVYGLATAIGMAIIMVPIMTMFAEMMMQIQAAAQQGGNAEPAFVKTPEMLAPDLSGVVMSTILLNLVTVALLAAAVARRLHDKDRSAWWGLLPLPCLVLGVVLMPTSLERYLSTEPDPRIALMSLANFGYFALLVLLVVLLVGVGTNGPNRFGPDSGVPDRLDPRS